MKLPRRNFLHLATGAAALSAASRIARAQAYPTRPVRWIVGFAPGGTTDILARLMAQWLSERLGTSIYAYPSSSAACAQSRIFVGSVPISSEGKKAFGRTTGFQ
jgi:hypothetical protein